MSATPNTRSSASSGPPSPHPVLARDSGEARKVAFASFVGTSIEYYDFFIYGAAAALIFPAVFFPEYSPFIGTLLAFASFGVGFVARPVGAVVFGHFGDRIGRKKMLVVTLMLMGVSTTLVGVLPTYASIGTLAPLLLVALRFVQGFAVGGEWGGAVLMSVEHAPNNRRGLYGALAPAGAPVGTVLSTGAFLLVTLLPRDDFMAWGWRLPFLASAVLVLVGLFVRLSVSESPLFQELVEKQKRSKLPMAEVLRDHFGRVLLVAGAQLALGAVAYIYVAYLPNYATSTVGVSPSTILTVVVISGVVCTVVLASSGALSDRFGRKPMIRLGLVGIAVTMLPSFALINTGSFWLMLFGHALVFGVFFAIAAGPIGALYAEAFRTKVRYTGISLAYTISQVLGGGLAPIVAAILLNSTGSGYSIALYMVALSLISLVSLFFLEETQNKTIDA